MSLLHSTTLRGAGFAHAFSTREDGDFAILRDREALRANQARLARGVGFAPELLHQTRQVHGAHLVVADGRPVALLEVEADALVAEPASGHAVAVRVADCVPVLLADRESGRVAAVHAGWRGIEARVLGVAVDHLRRAEGSGRASFVAAIGPCIGACCFEVGIDVARRIAAAASPGVVRRTESSSGVSGRRSPDGEGEVVEKAFVDLRLAARDQLRALGLDDGAIDDVPGCTRCDFERFHSYRRDGDASGRLVGVIVAGVSTSARGARVAAPQDRPESPR